jgi:hypothetical protein
MSLLDFTNLSSSKNSNCNCPQLWAGLSRFGWNGNAVRAQPIANAQRRPVAGFRFQLPVQLGRAGIRFKRRAVIVERATDKIAACCFLGQPESVDPRARCDDVHSSPPKQAEDRACTSIRRRQTWSRSPRSRVRDFSLSDRASEYSFTSMHYQIGPAVLIRPSLAPNS